jgi:hypothetical protein
VLSYPTIPIKANQIFKYNNNKCFSNIRTVGEDDFGFFFGFSILTIITETELKYKKYMCHIYHTA